MWEQYHNERDCFKFQLKLSSWLQHPSSLLLSLTDCSKDAYGLSYRTMQAQPAPNSRVVRKAWAGAAAAESRAASTEHTMHLPVLPGEHCRRDPAQTAETGQLPSLELLSQTLWNNCLCHLKSQQKVSYIIAVYSRHSRTCADNARELLCKFMIHRLKTCLEHTA